MMGRRIHDLDDRDSQARAGLRIQLRARREELGISQFALGEKLGWQAANVRRLERQGVDQSYAHTVMRWARALGLRLAVEPVGFPKPWTVGADRVDRMLSALATQMYETGRCDTADEWEVLRLTKQLVGIRLACGVTQDQLAGVFGVSTQAVSLFEIVDKTTSLVALQRHARGIARCSPRWRDGYLCVRLEPDIV